MNIVREKTLFPFNWHC